MTLGVSSDVTWKLFAGLLGRLEGISAGPGPSLSVLAAWGILLRPLGGLLGASWRRFCGTPGFVEPPQVLWNPGVCGTPGFVEPWICGTSPSFVQPGGLWNPGFLWNPGACGTTWGFVEPPPSPPPRDFVAPCGTSPAPGQSAAQATRSLGRAGQRSSAQLSAGQRRSGRSAHISAGQRRSAQVTRVSARPPTGQPAR